MHMINVMIVDDQVLLRKSIGKIIESDSAISVVAMAGNGLEAISKCKHQQIDLILMDIEMPKMNGIESLKHIKSHFPSVKVIMLTTFDNKTNIIEAFMAMANGYITKDISPDELVSVIKCVNYGLTVIHDSVNEMIVEAFARCGQKSSIFDKLSKKEMEIVKLIVSGKSNKAIAEHLNYSEGTIKNKVSRIYEKIGVDDRLKLAVLAVENGIEG